MARGVRPNRVISNVELEDDVDISVFDIPSSGSDTSSDSGISDDNGATTSRIQELLSAMYLGLESLFRATVFLGPRSTEKHQRVTKSETLEDTMCIRDQYPRLAENEPLTARLGLANARWRQYFRYRKVCQKPMERNVFLSHQRANLRRL